MIVDDDDDLTYLLENILKTRNMEVMSVHSLHDARECLASSKPDVIFLDNSFPDGIGVNFIGNIRSTGDDIQIIMMTSDTSAWVRKKAMEEGAHYFLEKPFSRKTIDQLLDQVPMQNTGWPATRHGIIVSLPLKGLPVSHYYSPKNKQHTYNVYPCKFFV
jgi:DNA-binding NtrC family response regulator